jgi:UDP-N-acetylmuramoylalanine--D-glutamate ligase
MFLSRTEPRSWFQGRKVTVMGLGLFGGGKGVTEFLCAKGAEVTVTDRRGRETLAPIVTELEHLSIRWVLGVHEEADFTGADLVVPSPAVPRDHPLLDLSRRRGVPLDTEMNLFFKYCRGKICAVTGSNGKTTTTSLVGAMTREGGLGTRVGGNLGKSLLPEVDSIAPDEWVVLELSSFQLEDLAALPRRPEVGVVTNLSVNHLDRHGTYDAYLEAKRRIVDAGPPPNVAVLNGEDAIARTWGRDSRRVCYFGRTAGVEPRAAGVWVDMPAGAVRWAAGGRSEHLFATSEVPLVGSFNLLNAAAAAAAAIHMGIPPERVRTAVRGFRPVDHRLEPVAEHDGVRYINDSVATTPESTKVALEALGPRLVLICGGSEKGCSFAELGRVIARRARAVVLIGQTAGAIDRAIPRSGATPVVEHAARLEEAVERARALARPGDIVLLSPACPSYDQFTNFVERGDRFRRLARGVHAPHPSSMS